MPYKGKAYSMDKLNEFYYSIMLFLLDIVRPPELLQFMDDVIPILHGERTFASHHDGHGDVVVGAIDICIPKPITQVEHMATFTLFYVLTNLRRTFHVQDTSLTFVFFNQLSQYLLAIAFSSQFLSHGKVPNQLTFDLPPPCKA